MFRGEDQSQVYYTFLSYVGHRVHTSPDTKTSDTMNTVVISITFQENPSNGSRTACCMWLDGRGEAKRRIFSILVANEPTEEVMKVKE